MKKKSSNAKKIILKKLQKKLKKKKIKSIYNNFEKLLLSKKLSGNLAVAVSGGADSMALAFLAKCYSIFNNINVKYYHLDHRLRFNSKTEANLVKSKLKKFDINCKILTWKGKKPNSNIQSIARENRYKLFLKESIKDKVKTILVGHHIEDLYESFLLRLLRGSGLKGLTSFSTSKTKVRHNSNVSILRPLININKKNLIYITKNTFNFYLKDPSNQNILFKRVRIRKLINNLKKEGLDERKLKMTINNLSQSNLTINYYVNKNVSSNSNFFKVDNKLACMIKEEFFNQPNEIIFRSMGEILKKIGGTYYAPRGKSITNLLSTIKSKKTNKTTLSGCIIEKLTNSWIIYAENGKKI